MSKMTHVLELNGRRYNAMTGALIADMEKSVDGMLHPAAQPVSRPATDAHHPTDVRHQPVAELNSMHAERSGTHHQKHHQLQHSKTLMRHTVHHPNDSFKRHLKAAPHTGTLVKASSFDIVPKHSADFVDPKRLKHAHTVARSQLVRRFAADSETLRATQPAVAARAAMQQPQLPVSHEPQQRAAPAHQPSYDVFEHALATANSHKEPYRPVKHKSKKLHRMRQITSITASSLVILLIVGFVAYQNSALIQLRLASSSAGINATLPTWQPSGFKLGAFTTAPGSVSVDYKNIDGQTFTIAQKSSNWDSNSLLSEYVYPSNNTYDTLSAAGTTIYTYGKNNATWVNGGIWYKLTSNGELSNTQIVNIATSMQS